MATTGSQTPALPCRTLLEKELEAMGIRLNRKAPNIYFKVCCSLSVLRTLTEQLGVLTLSLLTLFIFLPSLLLRRLPQRKKGGGLSINSMVKLTTIDEKMVQMILHDYSICF